MGLSFLSTACGPTTPFANQEALATHLAKQSEHASAIENRNVGTHTNVEARSPAPHFEIGGLPQIAEGEQLPLLLPSGRTATFTQKEGKPTLLRSPSTKSAKGFVGGADLTQLDQVLTWRNTGLPLLSYAPCRSISSNDSSDDYCLARFAPETVKNSATIPWKEILGKKWKAYLFKNRIEKGGAPQPEPVNISILTDAQGELSIQIFRQQTLLLRINGQPEKIDLFYDTPNGAPVLFGLGGDSEYALSFAAVSAS